LCPSLMPLQWLTTAREKPERDDSGQCDSRPGIFEVCAPVRDDEVMRMNASSG
jgi:hypothetical protein